MDAYPKLTVFDVDVYLPDLLLFQIRKRLRKCCPWFTKPFPNGADISTSPEEIVGSDSEREIRLHVVGVVFLLVRASRREMSLGVRIRAPAPQGPVLPPPPPVDYGVFMQGLVQAMQTQAHTQVALQAQLEAQQAQAPAPQADHGGPSIMEQFKRMSPPSFKGESDPLLAESWMREIEKIFWAFRCAEDDKVTLATHMLQALNAACRQEGEMEQYLEEKKASQKWPAAPF
ncbi:hypothetical protein Taro_007452 [Colocasia esculenta]|uniref:Uncharacterized protein n=1 Tax=Colocasia esculenta TaxID=4460 RepID=A0A843TYZ2_COLES|nr:hypothetical protein [Colocasia esculenta]